MGQGVGIADSGEGLGLLNRICEVQLNLNCDKQRVPFSCNDATDITWHICLLKKIMVYLKVKFNSASCIFYLVALVTMGLEG